MAQVVGMTQDQVSQSVDALKKFIKMGKMLALITPTKYDDVALDYAENIVNTLEPFVEQPWFADLITFLQNLGKKNISRDKLAKAVEDFKANLA